MRNSWKHLWRSSGANCRSILTAMKSIPSTIGRREGRGRRGGGRGGRGRGGRGRGGRGREREGGREGKGKQERGEEEGRKKGRGTRGYTVG